MKTLAIISHKGGAGKTSSSVMLAEDLAGRGLKVVLVDADRQRGAGLLLGIDQPTGGVQQTRVLRLQYFCSSGIPLRELPQRAEELKREFDVAVVDTPSLDDPLAKGWLQLSTHLLLVIPVEPLSIRTMDAADTALETIRRLNPSVEALGVLPAMFDENDATHRSLMMELMSLRSDTLLSPPIPLDSGLAHRAEQKADRRTSADEATVAAYHTVTNTLVKALGLAPVRSAAPAKPWSKPGRAVEEAPEPEPPEPEPAAARPAKAAKPARAPRAEREAPAPAPAAGGMKPASAVPLWAVALGVLLLLAIGIGIGVIMMLSKGGARSGDARPAPARVALVARAGGQR